MSQFSGELREAILANHAAVPAAERQRCRWVMSLDWLEETRYLDNGQSFWCERPGEPIRLLGLPVEIRERGGLPHLEPDPAA